MFTIFEDAASGGRLLRTDSYLSHDVGDRVRVLQLDQVWVVEHRQEALEPETGEDGVIYRVRVRLLGEEDG